MGDCKILLDRLVSAAFTDIDELKKAYSDKELSSEQLRDMKWSGTAIMAEAYLASIANSLAVIADSLTEKGEKDEETDRD